MPVRHRTAALALGALLTTAAASLAMAPSLVAAQQPAPVAAPHHEHPLPSRHVEGRIAFLHAELKITPAQQAQWDRVAAAMRTSAQQMDQVAQLMRATRDQPQNAVERLDQRARFVEARATAEKSFAEAFKPLYAVLSADQKQAADELFDRSFHGGRRHGRG